MQACPNHIHMLVEIVLSLIVSKFVGFLKWKSSLMIFDRHFWCRGYYVDAVGRNEGVIKEYIRNQLQEDIIAD